MIDFYYNTIFYILIIIVIILLLLLLNRYFSNNSETYQDASITQKLMDLIKEYHPDFTELNKLDERFEQIINNEILTIKNFKNKEELKTIIDKIIYKYNVLTKLNNLQIIDSETIVKDNTILYPNLPPNFLISKFYLEKYYNYINIISPYIGIKPINKSIGNCFEKCTNKNTNKLYYIHVNSKFLKFNGINSYQTKHISKNEINLICKNNKEYKFGYMNQNNLDLRNIKNCINDIDMIFSLIKVPNKNIYDFYTTEQNINGIKPLTSNEKNEMMYPFYIVAPLKYPKVFLSLDIKNDNSKTKFITIKYPLNETIRNTQRFYFSEDKIPSNFKLLSTLLQNYNKTCNNKKNSCK